MQLLERGGVLAIPTESSYGLAVDPTDPAAVASIRRIKGRAAAQPLPLVVADIAQARCLGADLTAPIVASLAALWPAPLTLVVPLFRPLAAAGGSDDGFLDLPRSIFIAPLCQLRKNRKRQFVMGRGGDMNNHRV